MQGLWDAGRSYQRIVLKDVQTEAHIGLHPWEQHPERPTRLLVNVEIFAPLPDAPGEAASPATIIDYDTVRTAIRAWPARPHTPLLETLAEELVGLCLADPRVGACRVSVMKPDIFNDAAAAGVEFYRVRPAAG
jgi:dihydroneopterin aldolase